MECKLALTTVIFAVLIAFASGDQYRQFEFEYVSSIAARDQTFNEKTAEIPAYDPESGYLYVSNTGKQRLDIFDIYEIEKPTYLGFIDLSKYGMLVPSVAIYNSVLAVSVSNFEITDNGNVFLYDISEYPPVLLSQIEVGALPDQVTFTPDGFRILVANEGEPNLDYSVDPEGTISVIRLITKYKREAKFTVEAIKKYPAKVTTLNFNAFDKNLAEYQRKDSSIRIYGKGASVSQDLEPEYITVSDDGKDAWVILQENNAIAHIDLQRLVITDITGLGYKDARLTPNSFDGVDSDKQAKLANWPVSLMYQPDEAKYFQMGRRHYVFTANEGDKRDFFTNFNEVAKVKDLKLDPTAFPNGDTLKKSGNLGNLRVSTPVYADPDHDGDIDVLYSFGGRSISIYDVEYHQIVYDSNNDMEDYIAKADPTHSNSRDDSNDSMDARSSTAGPEPEGVNKGIIDGVLYFFVGLDKQGGVFMFELQDPKSPTIKAYINHRIWSQKVSQDNIANVGDLGPEGVLFIPKDHTIDGNNLIVLSNTVSGTISIFRINRLV